MELQGINKAKEKELPLAPEYNANQQHASTSSGVSTQTAVQMTTLAAPFTAVFPGSKAMLHENVSKSRDSLREEIRNAVGRSCGIGPAGWQDTQDIGDTLNPRNALWQHRWMMHGGVFPVFPTSSDAGTSTAGERIGWQSQATETAQGARGATETPAPSVAANREEATWRKGRFCKCPVCGKCFPDNYKLERHSRIHTGEKPFTCSQCTKAFAVKDRLVAHERIHSGERPFSCELCRKSFSRKDKLTVHRRVHLGQKPFRCEMCGKTYAHKDKLVVHRRSHSGERPFSCELCRKAFARKDKLNEHRRAHAGDRPYRCNLCGKSYAQKDKLTVHERVHSGEKPFACEVCSKAFARKDKLTVHRRVHTGERPFCCKICGKAFKESWKLKRHESLHINRYYQGAPI